LPELVASEEIFERRSEQMVTNNPTFKGKVVVTLLQHFNLSFKFDNFLGSRIISRALTAATYQQHPEPQN
jgi:hypothetical protein